MASSLSWTPDPVNLPLWALDPACPRVERYLLGPEIGRGGMGRVHFAWDPMLRRLLAVKLLHGDDPEQHLRLLKEARNQAKLDHPNICRIHDLGMEGTRPYIAMQLILGNPLPDLRPYLDFKGIASLMAEVASGIHAAHMAGLIHRDLKPANILVTGRGTGKLVPFVVDFGLARDLQSQDQTLSWAVMGTPAFMSPEQARGEALGPGTDIYSLGATLYAMLSGHPPYEGCTLGGLISQQADKGVQAVRRLNRDTPKDLETITLKCLESEPSQRYASALALEQDLRRWLAGEPIQARHVGPAGKLWRWCRRKPTLAATAAAGLLSVAALSGWNAYIARQSRLRENAAQHFGQEAERVEALVRYTRILPLHDIRPENSKILEKLRQMELEAKKAGPLAEAPSAYALGRGYFALGAFSQARQNLDRAWEKGFRTPECSYALARSMAMDYQRRMQEALRLADPTQRQERVAELERSEKGPLLEKFRTGQRVSLEPLPFQEGMFAWFEGQGEKALGNLRQAYREAPWFYESKRLEAQILSAMAQSSSEPAKAEDLFDAALAAFKEAQRTAASDPALILGEARLHRDRMALAWRTGHDPLAQLKACEEACDRAQRVDPGSPEGDSIRAWALAALGRYRMERSGDSLLPLNEASRLLDQTLRRDPSHLETLKTAIFAHSVRGNLLWSQKGDPRPDFVKAIQAAKRAMDLDPTDADIGLRGAVASSLQLLYESYMGLEPWESFEQGLQLAMRASQAQPRLAAPDASIGMLWACRADCEEKRGLDPAPSVRAADTALRQAIGKAPRDFSYWVNLGNAHQTLAITQINRGENPQTSLEAAMRAYTEAHRLNPGQFQSSLYIGMLHYRRAQRLLATGQNPAPELAQARTWLLKGRSLNPGYWTFAYQGGLIALLEGRGRLRFGGDAMAAFREADREFTAALQAGSEAPHWVRAALAELAEVRGRYVFSRGGDLSVDLAKGLLEADRALVLNPRYAEGHLRKGGLELLAAEASRVPRTKGERARSAIQSFQATLALNVHLAQACRAGMESAQKMAGL